MISVVIPLFNKEASILKTLNSVLNQTFTNFELIIVDDGSNDNGALLIKEITDPRVKYYFQKNRGVSSARNFGIKNSKFSIIAILDADDLWEPDFLYDMLNLNNEFQEASLYGCACYYVTNNINTGISNYGVQENYRGYLSNYFELAIDNTLFNSSSVIFKKEDFFEIGGFDETLSKGEDIDLWIRFALNKKVAYLNKPLSKYVLDASNRATNINTNKSGSLIWNTERYSHIEDADPTFKNFIDGWRLAHITNYLKRSSTEVDNIKPLLKKIKLNNYSIFYRILMVLPAPLHIPFYKSWNTFKRPSYQ